MSDHDSSTTPSDSFGDAIAVDCGTCLAANTTACNDCLVTHLLANDDGPIELVVADPRPRGSARTDEHDGDEHDGDEHDGDDHERVDRVVELFVAVGLCDDPPQFVSAAEFDAEGAVAPVPVH